MDPECRKSHQRGPRFSNICGGAHHRTPLPRVSRLGRLLFRSKHFRSPNPFQWNPATGLHMYVLWSIYHYLSLVLISSKWAPLIFIGSTSTVFILFVSTLYIGSVHFVCQHKGCSCLSNPWEILRGGQMEVRKHLGFKQLPQVAQSRIVCVLASLECNVKLIYGRSLHSDQHSHYTYNTKINSKFWLIMILNKISLDCKLIFNKIIKILGRVWQFRNTKEERQEDFLPVGQLLVAICGLTFYLHMNIILFREAEVQCSKDCSLWSQPPSNVL